MNRFSYNYFDASFPNCWFWRSLGIFTSRYCKKSVLIRRFTSKRTTACSAKWLYSPTIFVLLSSKVTSHTLIAWCFGRARQRQFWSQNSAVSNSKWQRLETFMQVFSLESVFVYIKVQNREENVFMSYTLWQKFTLITVNMDYIHVPYIFAVFFPYIFVCTLIKEK